MSITFKKLHSGEWGVIGPASSIRKGSTVHVDTRGGESRVVTVTGVTKPFDGLRIGFIDPTRPRASFGGSGECPACGVEKEPGELECWECGHRY